MDFIFRLTLKRKNGRDAIVTGTCSAIVYFSCTYSYYRAVLSSCHI